MTDKSIDGQDSAALRDGQWQRPWFIEVNTGVIGWPALTFPFQMVGAGTDEGQRCTRAASRAALKAARAYYRHDDTASYAPSLRLLSPSGGFVENLSVEG